jgi:diacylglycerol kinase (ATP)
MTAIALLHPDVSPRAVQPFQKINPDLQIRSSLSCDEQWDAALIFGGDGTVHRYLPELHKFKIPVLVVPAGSGNDFAKALGIRNTATALTAWRQFCANARNVKEIDLGMVRSGGEETLFCCVAGAGLDADANARANRMPMWMRSRGGYTLAALWSLARGRPAMITVRSTEPGGTGTNVREGPAWLAAVGNAHRYGGGLKIVPQAAPDDGLLDVCLVAKMNKFKVLCVLPTVFWGGHVTIEEVEYFRTASLRLESDPALEVYADGEPVCRTPADFSVISRGLKVIIPE